MKKNSLFISFFLCLFIFVSASFTQVIKKDGIYYRNYKLNPVTLEKQINPPDLTDESIEKTAEDSIRLIKQDFMVNTLDGEYGADQSALSAAIDGNGNYMFTWLDYRNVQRQLFAQFYNSNDEKIGSNFLVSEGALEGNNIPFAAANKNGDFVIAWLQNFSSVVVQRFNKVGQKIGGNIQVNATWAMNSMYPSVAVSNNGSFLVMWSNDNNNQVLARLFDKSGNPITSEIIVSDPGLRISSWGPGKYVAVDSLGNYCIVWSSRLNGGSSNIYFQKVTNSGQKIGNNIMVSDSTDLSENIFPEIVSTEDGHFLFAWEKNLNQITKSRVTARIINSEKFVTDEVEISEQEYYYPAFNISSDREGAFLINYRTLGDSYFQKIDKSGNHLNSKVKIKFNTQFPAYTYYGNLTNIIDDHFFCFTGISDRNDINLYVQKFDINLSPAGSLKKINDDTKSSWQWKPLVHFNDTGESIILWEDKRNGRSDLYAQVYDKEFNPIGVNIKINDTDADQWFVYSKKVKHLSNGTFVIAFSGSESYSNASQIFLQLINLQGNRIGKNVHVNEGVFYNNFDVALNVNIDNEILICWYDYKGAYIRKYNNQLSPISSVNNLMQSASEIVFSPLMISIDPEFNILAAWKNYTYNDGSSYSNEIYGQYFDGNGKSTSDILVLDKSDNNYASYFNVINDKNNFALAYNDRYQIKIKRKYYFNKEYSINSTLNTNGYGMGINLLKFDNQKLMLTFGTPYDIYAFYANDNKRKNALYHLHTYGSINFYYNEYNGTNSADIYNDNLIFAYENNVSAGTGLDVWAKVWKTDNTNFQNEVFLGTDFSSDFLFNNYPNPFNSNTRITYEILAYHKVKLAIYDVLGREVRVLVDTNQEKGLYEIDFDASDLPSGIYFCRLEAFDTIVKKMLLIK